MLRRIEQMSTTERYYHNSFPDYEHNMFESSRVERPISLVKHIGDQFIREKTEILYEYVMKHESNDKSVYVGDSGIVLALIKIANHFSTTSPEIALKCRGAVKLLAKSLLVGRDANKSIYASFLLGTSGPKCVKMLAARYENDETEVQKNLELFFENHKNMMEITNIRRVCDEVLYGLSGYLYSLLFIKENIDSSIVTPQMVDQVCQKIINSGRIPKACGSFTAPLTYIWHECLYFGAAHGVAGILYYLLDPFVLTLPSCINSIDDIRGTADKLFSTMLPTGNIPSSEGNNMDKLIQWCHGAPGVIYLALRCYDVFKDEKYYDYAASMADAVWKRGLLTKSVCLCHGTAGNAYSFVAMYKCKKDEKYLYYATKFIEHFLKSNIHYPTPDRPYSLYEGIAGLIYLLIDIKDPLNARFPAFETI